MRGKLTWRARPDRGRHTAEADGLSGEQKDAIFLARLERCYRDHHRLLKRVAARYLPGDNAECEDCVHTAFTRVLAVHTRYAHRTNLLPLLRTAVTNAARDERKRAGRRVRNMDDVSDIETRLVTASEADAADLTDELIRALFAMPARQRAAFVLIRIYDNDLPEAARRMGVRVKTMQNLLSVAVRRLAHDLGHPEYDTRTK